MNTFNKWRSIKIRVDFLALIQFDFTSFSMFQSPETCLSVSLSVCPSIQFCQTLSIWAVNLNFHSYLYKSFPIDHFQLLSQTDRKTDKQTHIHTNIYIYISGDSSLFLLLVPPTLCQLQFPTRGPWTQSKSS